MTMLSETDWELINAYADGELPAGDEEAISRRLTHDTALAAALAEVHAAKASLSLMRPVKEPALPVQRGSEFRRLALAASVAAAVAFGALYQFGGLTEDWRDAPADLHAAFSGNTYVLPEGSALPVISTALTSNVCSSIPIWILRQTRRFGPPCLRAFHSPSPSTLIPVLSISRCSGPFAPRYGMFTASVL